MRGLVASFDITFDDQRGRAVIGAGQQDPLLRPYLLYWDRIAYPVPSMAIVDVVPSADQTLLLEEGVLVRHVVGPTTPGPLNLGQDLVPLYLKGQFEVLAALEKSEPGCWALAQESPRIQFPSDIEANPRTVLVELANALPVPSYDTPLDQLLRFKQDRRAELVSLQTHLDELYSSVVSSGDVPHAKAAALKKVDTALADLSRSAKGRIKTEFLKSLKVGLNPVALGAAALVAASGPASLPLAALVLAVGTISFSLSIGPKIALSPETKPFAYVHSAIKKFGL
jgi:hypothetical protein